MIPLQLRVRDFLSYADPGVLDLSQVDVVCLSGPNGVGKSALVLDAITWALFGAARGCEGGQNQDRLIREGAEGAEVDLTFELGGDVYRVVRTRTRAKGDLRLLVRDGGAWTNLAAESLRETEARLGAILRMDYRTFTTSSFFLQGRADDFLTRMKPDERKEMFARLLDLGVYERLEAAARAREREAKASMQVHAERIAEIEASIAGAGDLEREVDEADASVADAKALTARAEAAHDTARAALAALEAVERSMRDEARALEDARARLAAEATARTAAESEVASLRRLLERRSEVDAAVDELAMLRVRLAELERLRDRYAAAMRDRVELVERVAAERRAIEVRERDALARAASADAQADALEGHRGALADVEAALAATEGSPAELDLVRARLLALREQDGALTARRGELERRGAEVAEHLDLVKRGGGECPVCRTALDPAHRRRIRRQLETEQRTIAADLDAVVDERERVREEGKRVASEERRLASDVAHREDLAARRATLLAQLERVAPLRAQAEADRAAASAERAVLDQDAVAADLRRLLDELDERIVGIGYDDGAHAAVRERIAALQPAADLRGRLDAGRERLPLAEAELARAQARCAELDEEVAVRTAALDAGSSALRDLPAARTALGEAVAARERARADEVAAIELAAQLRAQLAALEAKRRSLDDVRRAESDAALAHRRYQRLTAAFGRGGIPDRIIENALPELQAEANDILGRLTDYEMTLQFRMEKETKAKTVRETFDVLVHHDGGVRDYQMFSGGEAFRIAFAIRLALSKLLVRRAGARLETLVIDEGFGTQDPEGRERLVEAINLARTEFRTVVVITHLDDLKDAFGAQLRVWKDPMRGSAFELVTA